MSGNTSNCPECGTPVELEVERRLYNCSNCKADSYLVAGDANRRLTTPPAAFIGREGLAVLATRENELSSELRMRRNRTERVRGEHLGASRKSRLTKWVLTANMMIIAASAIILYLDPEVGASQLAAAGILLVLTILTLTFLFLFNSITQSAAYRMEILEGEERRVKKELDHWREKIDEALRFKIAGGLESEEIKAADEE